MDKMTQPYWIHLARGENYVFTSIQQPDSQVNLPKRKNNSHERENDLVSFPNSSTRITMDLPHPMHSIMEIN